MERSLIWLVTVGVSVVSTAAAQEARVGGWDEPIWSVRLGMPQDYASVTSVGDWTGDGVADFVTTTTFSGMKILDGVDGTTTGLSVEPGFWVDQSGDVTGDGLEDVVVCDWSEGQRDRVVTWDGRTGQPIWEVNQDLVGRPLRDRLLLFDADGDGVQDVLIVTLSNGRTVLRGTDGAVLWSMSEARQGECWVVDDRNGDGVPEIFADLGSGDSLVDGATGQELWRTSRGGMKEPWDAAVLDLDITGDGVEDLILAEPYAAGRAGRVSGRNGIDGALLWQTEGLTQFERLGTDAQLEDVTGDGMPEVVSVYLSEGLGESKDKASIHVLDALTGQPLWRRQWFRVSDEFQFLRADLNGDGVEDFVRTEFDWSAQYGYRCTVVAEDAASGTSLWDQLPLFEGPSVFDLVLAEVDRDGIPDLLANLANGNLVAISGADGKVLWWYQSSGAPWFSASIVVFDDVDGEQAVGLIEGDRELVALQAATGVERWRSRFRQNFGTGRASEIEVVNWGPDRRSPQLLVRSEWGASIPHEIRLHDLHDRGAVLWATQAFEFEWFIDQQSAFHPNRDLDGDGWLDPYFLASFEGGGMSLHALSGRTGTWRSGLKASVDELSAATGSSFRLEVQAAPERSGDLYQVLLSEAGAGISEIQGFDIPLVPGPWLTRTMHRVYPPGFFRSPVGALDQSASATVEVVIPPGVLYPWVGRTLGLAVVTWSQGEPSWTTGAAEVLVLP